MITINGPQRKCNQIWKWIIQNWLACRVSLLFACCCFFFALYTKMPYNLGNKQNTCWLVIVAWLVFSILFETSCFCISVWLLCLSRMLCARQFCLKKRRYIRTISEYILYRTFSHLFDYFTTFPWNCFYKWQFSFQNQNDEYKRNDHKCDCFSLKMEIEVFVRFFK